MRFRVLGTVAAVGDDGTPVPLSDHQRALLASLLARSGQVVSADLLVDLLWGDDPPLAPEAALHSRVSRLRRMLPGALITRAPGYLIEAGPADLDAARFDLLIADAADAADPVPLLDEALALWRGRAYGEFADTEVARFEAIRLEEARLVAFEQRAGALLGGGGAASALPVLEAFVEEHPLREAARALHMRALYLLNRQADALAAYQTYRSRLADDLGLEPSAGLQRLHLEILRQELPTPPSGPPPLADLEIRYLNGPRSRRLAWSTLGDGPPLVALPAWVSGLDVVASGRDPRSSLLQRLAEHVRLVLYDRYGTGLSRGPVDDFGMEPGIADLTAVVDHVGGPVNLLAMSQAGPMAVALAARRPELVDRIVFFGTYASGPDTFTRTDLNRALVDMVRAHWGLGSKVFADLYRPGASDDAARHMALVLRDSADREIAAGYLAATYETDVADLLPKVTAPALILHYNGDRIVPFTGGRQLAVGLPDARLLTFDGPYHLPDAADLDRIVQATVGFVGEP